MNTLGFISMVHTKSSQSVNLHLLLRLMLGLSSLFFKKAKRMCAFNALRNLDYNLPKEGEADGLKALIEFLKQSRAAEFVKSTSIFTMAMLSTMLMHIFLVAWMVGF